MPIHPRQMASGPQGRVLEKLADLEREVRQMREGRANQVQRSTASNDAGVSGVTSGSGVDLGCTASVTVPAPDSLVFLMWYARQTLTIGTDVGALGLLIDGVPPGSNVLWTHTGTTIATARSSRVANQTFGSDVINGYGTVMLPYDIVDPTAGDHTYGLWGSRQSGTGSVTFDLLRTRVVVV